MTQFVFAYDVESVDIAPTAVNVIADIHRRHNVPATMFIVGKVLETHGRALKATLDDPLFDLQTHTYSHRMLKDSGPHGPALNLDEMRVEVGRGKELIEDVFGRSCLGCRPGCGFYKGFQGLPERLAIFEEFGIEFVSGWLRDEWDSIPAAIEEPLWYSDDGFDKILEIPGHGWHDNVLKGFGANITRYPSRYEWAVPPQTLTNVDELVEHELLWVDQAIKEDKPFFSPVWHPWSLYRFDQGMGMVKSMILAAAERGMPTATYSDIHKEWMSSHPA